MKIPVYDGFGYTFKEMHVTDHLIQPYLDDKITLDELLFADYHGIKKPIRFFNYFNKLNKENQDIIINRKIFTIMGLINYMEGKYEQ
jgi:hypothetical protein